MKGAELLDECPRLRVEPMVFKDSSDWWRAIWCDAEVTRYLPSRRPLSHEQMERLMQKMAEHWEAHGFGVWALRDRTLGSLVGHCGLMVNEPPDVELIYAVARSMWGQGLATEAATCVLAHAFGKLGLDCVIALVIPENT